MADPALVATLVARIETRIHRDVGRGMQAVFNATKGGLWQAAAGIGAIKRPRIGLITGFFVPEGVPPAAETDGPAAVALLARGFAQAGVPCRIATDAACRTACEVALRTAGAAVPVDSLEPNQDPASLIAAWQAASIEWVIAVERCGPSSDGSLRNMRGVNISAYAAPLHHVFGAGRWRTIGIGDGGNELGMGNLPRSLIAGHVPLGEVIGCVTPADALITAGVSHWGGYALLLALALLRDDWRPAMLASLSAELDHRIIQAMVQDGPAVDGVTLRQASTIDGLSMAEHHAVLGSLLDVADAGGFSVEGKPLPQRDASGPSGPVA